MNGAGQYTIPKCNQNTQIFAMHQMSVYHRSAANVKQPILHYVANAESTTLFVPLKTARDDTIYI